MSIIQNENEDENISENNNIINETSSENDEQPTRPTVDPILADIFRSSFFRTSNLSFSEALNTIEIPDYFATSPERVSRFNASDFSLLRASLRPSFSIDLAALDASLANMNTIGNDKSDESNSKPSNLSQSDLTHSTMEVLSFPNTNLFQPATSVSSVNDPFIPQINQIPATIQTTQIMNPFNYAYTGSPVANNNNNNNIINNQNMNNNNNIQIQNTLDNVTSLQPISATMPIMPTMPTMPTMPAMPAMPAMPTMTPLLPMVPPPMPMIVDNSEYHSKSVYNGSSNNEDQNMIPTMKPKIEYNLDVTIDPNQPNLITFPAIFDKLFNQENNIVAIIMTQENINQLNKFYENQPYFGTEQQRLNSEINEVRMATEIKIEQKQARNGWYIYNNDNTTLSDTKETQKHLEIPNYTLCEITVNAATNTIVAVYPMQIVGYIKNIDSRKDKLHPSVWIETTLRVIGTEYHIPQQRNHPTYKTSNFDHYLQQIVKLEIEDNWDICETHYTNSIRFRNIQQHTKKFLSDLEKTGLKNGVKNLVVTTESLIANNPTDQAIYNDINKIGINNNPYATCCKLHDNTMKDFGDLYKYQKVHFSIKFSSISDKKNRYAPLRSIFIQAWDVKPDCQA